MRLNIAAGTAVRFEPGDTREVELVALGGRREVYGLNRLVEGRLDDEKVAGGGDESGRGVYATRHGLKTVPYKGRECPTSE